MVIDRLFSFSRTVYIYILYYLPCEKEREEPGNEANRKKSICVAVT